MAISALVDRTLAAIAPLDEAAMAAARARQDTLTKPLGSLGRLEELSVRLAGIFADPIPSIGRKCVILAAGDHGVVAEGVSAYPQEVTPQMVANFLSGGAAINVLAQIECSSNGWHSFAGLLRMEGYIASARGFANQPEILDRASRLFVDVLGKPGAHARAAFSVEQLPLNASVERVVTFAVKPVTETNTPARSASTSPSQARRLAPECPSRLGYEAAGIGPQMAQDLT